MREGVTLYFPSRWTAKRCIDALNASFPECRGRFTAENNQPCFRFALAQPSSYIGPQEPPYTKENLQAPGRPPEPYRRTPLPI